MIFIKIIRGFLRAMYHIAYFDEDEEIIAQQIDKLSEDVASREIKDDL